MLMVAVESPAPGTRSVSSDGTSVASGVPHCEQNFAPSGFALPQLVQYGIDDRLLSNPQGRAEVDGCCEPIKEHPAAGAVRGVPRTPPTYGRDRSLAERRLVRRGVHQAVDRGGVRGHELVEPAPAVRVAVDQLRRRVQALVDRHDLAVDGRVDVADRLRRLQLTAGGAGRDGLAERGQRHVDDVTE